MKQWERCSGRRGSTGPLHQKYMARQVEPMTRVLLMGWTKFRQGGKYQSGQQGNVKALRVETSRPKKQNKITANDELFLMAA